MKKDPTDQEKETFQQHQTNKKVAKDLKSQDEKDAEESNGKWLRKNGFRHSSHIYQKAFLMYWESVAKRDANEISSCLLDFIHANVDQGAKEFRFWSDNCAGQNRNSFVFSLYCLTHRFLQKGHTQNEEDSVHSVIERASQTKNIFTPHQWRLLVRRATNEGGEPYVVRNVTQNDVFNFKCLVNNKVRMKDVKGKKINWNNIREVHADGSDPNKLFFKYELTQPDYNILVIHGNTRNSVQTALKHEYSEPIMILAAKYKDLMDMCHSEVIPLEYHPYFNSLPHHTIVDDSEESDDDLSE